LPLHIWPSADRVKPRHGLAEGSLHAVCFHLCSFRRLCRQQLFTFHTTLLPMRTAVSHGHHTDQIYRCSSNMSGMIVDCHCSALAAPVVPRALGAASRSPRPTRCRPNSWPCKHSQDRKCVAARAQLGMSFSPTSVHNNVFLPPTPPPLYHHPPGARFSAVRLLSARARSPGGACQHCDAHRMVRRSAQPGQS
jgi:hypothetical protein